jgi:hypothetical protein
VLEGNGRKWMMIKKSMTMNNNHVDVIHSWIRDYHKNNKEGI